MISKTGKLHDYEFKKEGNIRTTLPEFLAKRGHFSVSHAKNTVICDSTAYIINQLHIIL